jgi:hypothetical protein
MNAIRTMMRYFGIVSWSRLSRVERRREALVGAIVVVIALPLALLGHWTIALAIAVAAGIPHAIAVQRAHRNATRRNESGDG